MHIDGPDKITVSGETALFTVPLSPFGLVSMTTDRTLATCSSFGAGEAHDVDLFGFVGEVVEITAVLPKGHALVMASATIAVTDAMRIPNEERTNLMLNTEVDHLPGGFVSHVTHPAL